MASSSTASYPKLSVAAWRALRARAAQAPTQKFNAMTVATLLSYDSTKSAGDNVVYPLQKLGLIDENGALTDRGNKWRIDDSYAEACQEMLDSVYPSDLATFTSADGRPDKAQVQKWFQYQKFGEANALKMAATYVMIAEKKVPAAPAEKDPKAKAATKPKQATSTAAKVSQPTSVEAVTPATPPTPAPAAQRMAGPDIHLDFQIHIDADTSPEVIEQIFASMAKHLKGLYVPA
jgi:hypothetical protein